MSRTYKDKPYKFIREVDYDDQYDRIEYEAEVYSYEPYYKWHYKRVYTGETRISTFSIKKAGVFTKKKRNALNRDDWWFRCTPSWWTHMTSTVPKRAACRNWAKTLTLENLEEADCPDYGNKPHSYYW